MWPFKKRPEPAPEPLPDIIVGMLEALKNGTCKRVWSDGLVIEFKGIEFKFRGKEYTYQTYTADGLVLPEKTHGFNLVREAYDRRREDEIVIEVVDLYNKLNAKGRIAYPSPDPSP